MIKSVSRGTAFSEKKIEHAISNFQETRGVIDFSELSDDELSGETLVPAAARYHQGKFVTQALDRRARKGGKERKGDTGL